MIAERGFETKKTKTTGEWEFNEQESYGLAVAALLHYFAGCDENVSEDEAALIEATITPIIDTTVSTDAMLVEVAKIKETKPLTFSHLKKYLMHVETEALDEFNALVAQIINASDGVSAAEKEAKAKFEDYLKERKKA